MTKFKYIMKFIHFHRCQRKMLQEHQSSGERERGIEVLHTWSRSSLCVHTQLYLQSLRGQGGGVEGVEQRVDRDQKSQKVSFPSLVRTL